MIRNEVKLITQEVEVELNRILQSPANLKHSQ